MINIKVPFRLVIAGSSSSGKSSLFREMLIRRDNIFDKKFAKILYCTRSLVNVPDGLFLDPFFEFHQGLPDESILESKAGLDKKSHLLIVVDDGMTESVNSSVISTIFTEVSFFLLVT